MAFNSIKIIGNGTAQQAINNSAVLEAVVNSLVAYNTTGGTLTFSLLINGVAFVTESVSANSSFRMPDKLNIPANSILTVNAASGISVSVSYFQQAIDPAASLSVIQQLAADAAASATDASNTYDAFDDRYLGAKASDPTLDNDNNALTVGALYFNTTSNDMKVWDGSIWSVAYVPAGAYLVSGDIGTSVQGYDINTAKYNDVTANFTGTLQNSGSDVLVDTDIDVTVQGYNANTAKYDDVTANFTGTLQNGGSNVIVDTDIGSTVQAYDSTILNDAAIGVTVQGYDADTAKLDIAQIWTAQQTFAELKETTYTLGTSGSIAVDPANGSVQTTTLSGDPTFTDSLEAGQSVVLMINGGASYTVTWPAITWCTATGNAAPTLTANDTLVFWKTGTTLYGAVVGSYA